DNILLPLKQQPADAKTGDYLDVFIYRDSEDRLIATMREPLAKVGDLACLKVTAQTKIGAFLDIGLERGLFLPFREQKYPLMINRSYLVYVYLDKSGRLSCTTDIYKYLTSDSPYHKNDKVTGTIYFLKPETGAFVAVDNKYLGLIPSSEYFSNLKIGDTVEARVIRVREDGKLDLSPRELSFKQMDADAETLLKAMQDNQGYLSLDEKARPEEIEQEFQMSKAAFKRAIGGLLKTRKITKTESGYKLL
ncbi:MAG TPA: S1-like domain-containing RNA-binding protein, partial [Desulfitobacteriaceae bacterium]|nr:S1-like domain-containing RNA-binding protein [Desulfitobacteriaceae bacterium]